MSVRPRGRFEGVVVEQCTDGAVLHDTVTGRSHALDWDAVKVWSLANGQRTRAEIAHLAAVAEDAVHRAIETLAAKQLLVDCSDQSASEPGAAFSLAALALSLAGVPANVCWLAS